MAAHRRTMSLSERFGSIQRPTVEEDTVLNQDKYINLMKTEPTTEFSGNMDFLVQGRTKDVDDLDYFEMEDDSWTTDFKSCLQKQCHKGNDGKCEKTGNDNISSSGVVEVCKTLLDVSCSDINNNKNLTSETGTSAKVMNISHLESKSKFSSVGEVKNSLEDSSAPKRRSPGKLPKEDKTGAVCASNVPRPLAKTGATQQKQVGRAAVFSRETKPGNGIKNSGPNCSSEGRSTVFNRDTKVSSIATNSRSNCSPEGSAAVFNRDTKNDSAVTRIGSDVSPKLSSVKQGAGPQESKEIIKPKTFEVSVTVSSKDRDKEESNRKLSSEHRKCEKAKQSVEVEFIEITKETLNLKKQVESDSKKNQLKQERKVEVVKSNKSEEKQFENVPKANSNFRIPKKIPAQDSKRIDTVSTVEQRDDKRGIQIAGGNGRQTVKKWKENIESKMTDKNMNDGRRNSWGVTKADRAGHFKSASTDAGQFKSASTEKLSDSETSKSQDTFRQKDDKRLKDKEKLRHGKVEEIEKTVDPTKESKPVDTAKGRRLAAVRFQTESSDLQKDRSMSGQHIPTLVSSGGGSRPGKYDKARQRSASGQQISDQGSMHHWSTQGSRPPRQQHRSGPPECKYQDAESHPPSSLYLLEEFLDVPYGFYSERIFPNQSQEHCDYQPPTTNMYSTPLSGNYLPANPRQGLLSQPQTGVPVMKPSGFYTEREEMVEEPYGFSEPSPAGFSAEDTNVPKDSGNELFCTLMQQCSQLVKTEEDLKAFEAVVNVIGEETAKSNAMVMIGDAQVVDEECWKPPPCQPYTEKKQKLNKDKKHVAQNERSPSVEFSLSPPTCSGRQSTDLFEGRTLLKGGVDPRHIPKNYVPKLHKTPPSDPRTVPPENKLSHALNLPLPVWASEILGEETVRKLECFAWERVTPLSTPIKGEKGHAKTKPDLDPDKNKNQRNVQENPSSIGQLLHSIRYECEEKKQADPRLCGKRGQSGVKQSLPDCQSKKKLDKTATKQVEKTEASNKKKTAGKLSASDISTRTTFSIGSHLHACVPEVLTFGSIPKPGTNNIVQQQESVRSVAYSPTCTIDTLTPVPTPQKIDKYEPGSPTGTIIDETSMDIDYSDGEIQDTPKDQENVLPTEKEGIDSAIGLKKAEERTNSSENNVDKSRKERSVSRESSVSQHDREYYARSRKGEDYRRYDETRRSRSYRSSSDSSIDSRERYSKFKQEREVYYRKEGTFSRKRHRSEKHFDPRPQYRHDSDKYGRHHDDHTSSKRSRHGSGAHSHHHKSKSRHDSGSSHHSHKSSRSRHGSGGSHHSHKGSKSRHGSGSKHDERASTHSSKTGREYSPVSNCSSGSSGFDDRQSRKVRPEKTGTRGLIVEVEQDLEQQYSSEYQNRFGTPVKDEIVVEGSSDKRVSRTLPYQENFNRNIFDHTGSIHSKAPVNMLYPNTSAIPFNLQQTSNQFQQRPLAVCDKSSRPNLSFSRKNYRDIQGPPTDPRLGSRGRGGPYIDDTFGNDDIIDYEGDLRDYVNDKKKNSIPKAYSGKFANKF